MDNNKARSLAALLALGIEKDSGVVLRVSNEEKQNIGKLAKEKGFANVSDFLRDAVYYYVWATSEVELDVVSTNSNPEYIDLINKASYPIYLSNYFIADDTFDNDLAKTNKHRHSFHFGPLVFNHNQGDFDNAILYPGQVIRIYSGYAPKEAPRGVSIWAGLGCENKIWNDFIDKVSIYRIANSKSEDIIAGIPLNKLSGLKALLDRK